MEAHKWRNNMNDIEKLKRIKQLDYEIAEIKRKNRMREDAILITNVAIMIMKMVVGKPWNKESINTCASNIVSYIREHVV